MSFYKRYELDRLIADGDAKTFRAVENATGRPVLLHMFNPSGAAVLAVLKSKLARDPARLSPPLLELGDFAGSPYAVTEEVADFKDVRSWLAAMPEGPMPIPPAPTPEPAASGARVSQLRAPSRPGSTTDRFNQLFDEKPARPDEQSRVMRPPSPPAVAAPPTPRPAAAAAPPSPPPAPPQPNQGEFTRMFGVPSSPPKSVPPPAPQHEPGEFTRMFQAPGGSAAPAANSTPRSTPPAPAPQSGSGQTVSEPGEFTRWFKLPEQAGSQAPRSGSPSSPATPPPVAKSQGDDFERMFGPAPVQAPEPIESQANERGQFTGLFGMGQVGESINIEEEQARAARSGAPEARPFQAPSEFTRMFGPGEGRGTSAPPPPKTVRSASGLFGDPAELRQAVKGPGEPRTQTQIGPGEYTRIIATPKNVEGGGNNPLPAPPAKKNWVLWVAIGVPALALIVFAIIALLRSS